ncbi:MAG: hypothetical protein AABY22_30130 [Nanoarchaeota archaeon]
MTFTQFSLSEEAYRKLKIYKANNKIKGNGKAINKILENLKEK